MKRISRIPRRPKKEDFPELAKAVDAARALGYPEAAIRAVLVKFSNIAEDQNSKWWLTQITAETRAQRVRRKRTGP